MYQHQSVLLNEAVDALVTRVDGLYVDGTFGRGGHSKAILERLSSQGRLLVVDKDPEAIAVARALQAGDTRVEIHHGSFADLAAVVAEKFGVTRVCGVLLDLGVSSPQLDDASRGFSFLKDGPLDMRMNTAQGQSAAEWLQSAAEEEIADVIYQYGEERFSRRMARAIVKARAELPITGTLQLAEIIKEANPAWEKHKHPATRAFQGIRIFINSELQDLQRALAVILDLLEAGGRLVVISFHSLEDRIVKQFMQKQVRGDDFPPGVPVRQDQLRPRLALVGKALKGTAGADGDNVRARSAVMRVAEKLA
ncbi:MAG: 16S rRNA (cytosine(1402)-N(4))-methyltransferase RsmH [Pseudohongiellaceae bacterium]